MSDRRLQYVGPRSKLATECCFSIFYGENGHEQLNLCAPSVEVKMRWVSGLQQLRDDGTEVNPQQLFVRYAWREFDKNKDDKLSKSEVLRMLDRLNFDVNNRKAVVDMFKAIDTERRGYLNFAQFTQFFRKLRFRPEVERIFKENAKGNPPVMIASTFHEFLQKHQGVERLSDQDVRRLPRRMPGGARWETPAAHIRTAFGLCAMCHSYSS